MRLHENQQRILSFKKSRSLQYKKTASRLIKKNLGIQVCDNLTRYQNASTQASKTLKALWYLRRNLHHKKLPEIKIKA